MSYTGPENELLPEDKQYTCSDCEELKFAEDFNTPNNHDMICNWCRREDFYVTILIENIPIDSEKGDISDYVYEDAQNKRLNIVRYSIGEDE